MYFEHINQQIWVALMMGVSALALWRGATPERIVAVANVAAWFFTPIAQNQMHLFHPQWGMLMVDVAFLLVLVWQALSHDRYWLLFAAAFQLLSVIIHLAIVADPTLRSLVYMRGLVIWSYLVLAALAVGVWNVERRRRLEAQR